MGSHQSSAMLSDTWLTPKPIIEALGLFDLDPCAAPGWPTAHNHICLPEDGLAAPWEGRVWLNPPYGRESAAWLSKLADHGRGTALIFARTETAMFAKHVWPKASGIHFLTGRLHFHHADGTRAAANAGAPSCLISYGYDDSLALRKCGLPGVFVESWWQT